jgi:hypothetical protein
MIEDWLEIMSYLQNVGTAKLAVPGTPKFVGA